jgi:hypothetical protein
MPVHDWTRVSAATFHDFHGAWIVHLKETLNAPLEATYQLAFRGVPGVYRRVLDA